VNFIILKRVFDGAYKPKTGLGLFVGNTMKTQKTD